MHPGMYPRVPRVFSGSNYWDGVSHDTPTFNAAETQSRCARVSSRGVAVSDIDVEDVIDAVAPSEANAARTRAVAVSLAFRE
jgi:hypothetical protein